MHHQLGAKELKASKKSKKEGWLLGDGLPHLLTGDKFYQKVFEHTKAQEEVEAEKESQKQQKAELILEIEN